MQYGRLSQDDDDQDQKQEKENARLQVAWKKVSNDVFRAPPRKLIFACLYGAGI
jgi:hypothetical protein